MDPNKHDIWIEGPDHGHLSSPSDLKLKYGLDLNPEGLLDISRLTATLVDPKESRTNLVACMAPELTAEAYVVSFTPEQEGLYTVLLDYTPGIWSEGEDGRFYYASRSRCSAVSRSLKYQHYSKTVIPVGHGLAPETPVPAGILLEIVPVNFQRPAEGDDFMVQVLYQGSALPDADVRVVGGVEPRVIETRTDDRGLASVKFDLFGVWMFQVSYEDFNRGISGQYDGERITSALSVKVKP